jgi:hypothetical protein
MAFPSRGTPRARAAALPICIKSRRVIGCCDILSSIHFRVFIAFIACRPAGRVEMICCSTSLRVYYELALFAVQASPVDELTGTGLRGLKWFFRS